MYAYAEVQTINAGAIGNRFSNPDIPHDINNTSDAAIIWVCDLKPKSAESARGVCRVVGFSTDPDDIRTPPTGDAVAIIVPASRRYHL
jgi:hypothetical protein